MKISNLRCEYKNNPIGIDINNPRLTWEIDDNKNSIQKSFHIQISKFQNSFIDEKSLICNEEVVTDEHSFICDFELESEEIYWWRVGIVSTFNEEIVWSISEKFITGIMDKNWTPTWIRDNADTEVSLLRKDFHCDRKLKKAILSGTALGLYEIKLNGKTVNDDRLAPGWTDYNKRLYYTSYEVTDLISLNDNVIGGILAPGWYAGHIGPLPYRGFYGPKPFLSLRLMLEFEDNSRKVIETDESWLGKPDATTYADMIMGEEYDARLESNDWAEVSYEIDDKWNNVEVLNDSTLLPDVIENYPGAIPKVIEMMKPTSVKEIDQGKYVFDLQQNIVGVVRIELNNTFSGQEIIIKHAEAVEDDGTLYLKNLRDAKATDKYICKGADKETWEPKFTVHGFRYVEISGLTEKPSLDTVTGVTYSSIYKQMGSFECGLPKVNRLFQNVYWGLIDNYLDIPTDCPQRDERLGWTGDTQVFIRSAAYIADISAFMKKWLVDMDDAQGENGGYHEVAPSIGSGRDSRAAWADAGIICPYELWKTYNDTGFIRPFWNSMKKFMKHIYSDRNPHNSEETVTYGDWLNHDKEETDHRIIGLAYRTYDSKLMAEMAVALGEMEEASFYKKEAVNSEKLFASVFFNEDMTFKSPTQTAYALAICMDLLHGEELRKVTEALVENVENNNGYLTTGFVGVKFICPALTKIGRHDLAVQMLLNEGIPSWLYAVNNNATTIWERWDGWEHHIKEGINQHIKFGPDPLNSLNHYAYGAVAEWMFAYLAGLELLEPGYKKFRIAPVLDKRLGFVKCNYNSIMGNIKSEWKYEENCVKFTILVPTGTEAEIILPYSEDRIKSCIKLPAESVDSKTVYSVRAGEYYFECKESE